LVEEAAVVSGPDLDEVVHEVVDRVLAGGQGFLTILTGEDAPPLDGLVASVEQRHPEVEVEVHDGGQPHYPLLLVPQGARTTVRFACCSWRTTTSPATPSSSCSARVQGSRSWAPRAPARARSGARESSSRTSRWSTSGSPTSTAGPSLRASRAR